MSVAGVEGEERNDYTKAESRQIRQRSMRLLGSLLRPLRARIVLTVVVVVISTALLVAGPALIAYGINVGLPALRRQHGLDAARCRSSWRTWSRASAVPC